MIRSALQIAASLFLVALAACSPESVAPPGKLRIQVTNKAASPASRTLLTRAFEFMSSGTLKPVKRTLAGMPLTTDDFECFSVNITAGDINYENDLSDQSCHSSDQMQGAGFGIVSAAFNRGDYVDVDVPEGFGRNIDVYGLYPTPADCGGTETAIAGYYLGGLTQDLTGDATVTVPIEYDGSTPDLKCNEPDIIADPMLVAGSDYSCGLNRYGEVYCWGRDDLGQLGDDDTTQENDPVQVWNSAGDDFLTDVTSIAGGDSHVCVATDWDGVQCWGDNTNGQLGNNSTTQSGLPVDVSDTTGTDTLSDVYDVAAGQQFSCALDNSGNVYCWGNNTSGQLGDTTTTNRLIPVEVTGVGGTGVLSDIDSFVAGGTHACAVD